MLGSIGRGVSRFLNGARTGWRDPQQRVLWSSKSAGITVTHENAFQIAAAWACIDIVAKSISAQRWDVFTTLPNGDRDLQKNDKIAYLLNCRPNREMTAIAFRECMAICAQSYGNGYAEIEWSRGNQPVALWPLPPDCVDPIRSPDDGRLVYRIKNDRGEATYLEIEDVLHFHGPGISGLVGDDVIAKAIHTLGLSMAAERFGESYFGNNTEIGGTLEYSGKLDDKTYDRLKTEWERRHKGPNKSFRPAILEGGIKWNPNTTDADKAQLLETRKFQIEEICRWFGVPPHKIAHLDRSTFNNIEHQGLEFVRDALTPWAIRFQQEVDYKLFSDRGAPKFTLINLKPLSQGDAVSRGQFYVSMRNIGVYSANDILRMEGENTIGPEGDIRYVNGSAIRLEDVGKNYLPAQTPADTSAPGQGSNTDPTVTNAFKSVFQSVFDRAESRRRNRLADLERHPKPEESTATAMFAFAKQQEGFLHDNLRMPSETFGEICGADTFAAAVAAGRRVLNGTQSPRDAASELVESFMQP